MAKNQSKSNAGKKGAQSSGRENQSGSQQSNKGQSGQRNVSGPQAEGLPLDDLTYDVITVLHEKSKGLEVYEQYLEDASQNDEVRQVFETIYEQDQLAVERLEQVLRSLISGGQISGSEGIETEEIEEEEEVA